MNGVSQLPNWMILFAFFASLVFTILTIIEVIFRITHKPKVDFRLTREVFLRLLDVGECLYAHGVLVASGSGALIKRVEALLDKEKGAVKSFPLSVILCGEKYRSEIGIGNYYFHSTSPLAFIPEHIPQRIVYLCLQEFYSTSIKDAIRNFNLNVYDIKEKYGNAVSLNEDQISDIRESLTKKIEEACSKIIDSVQIEAGKYKLTVILYYQQKDKVFFFLPWEREKRAISSIQFEVEDLVRDHLRLQVNETFRKHGLNILLSKSEAFAYPEYLPINVKEI